jgi:citrate lyase subunit beta/citryl-CoA lyase
MSDSQEVAPPALTMLFVPGDRPDRFATAISSGADIVILDLEDAVAPARKAYALQAVVEFLEDVHDVPCLARIASVGDLRPLVGARGLHGVQVPKVTEPDDLATMAAEHPGLALHVLIETALGVERAYDIATAHPQVAGVMLGEADLASDLGIPDEIGFTWARSRLVVAARAAGLPPPAMSVWSNLRDEQGLRESCRLGRRLGLFGRAAIHPKQLPIIVEAFLPSVEEVRNSEALLAEFAAASDLGKGTAVLADGRFADRAMVGAAKRVVEIAERYGVGVR